MDARLIITDIGLGITTLLNVAVAVLVLMKDYKRPTNLVFAALNLAVAIFQIGHLVGISVADGGASRQALLFTMATIFTVAFTAHLTYLVTGEAVKKKFLIATIYAVATALLLYFVSHPSDFLLNSVPKMYLPNYYAPGRFYILFILYFSVTVAIFVRDLVKKYFDEQDDLMKNRLRYFLGGVIMSYMLGGTGFFLVYDVKVDPLLIIFSSFYAFTFGYGILKYDLMDIKVVAKRALIYAVLVALVGALISAVNIANDVITKANPNFPTWLIPLFSAVAAVGIGAFVWRQLRETDVLKYEFITVVTHKFRTPLTYIKWSLGELKNPQSEEEKTRSLDRIAGANAKLVELTDILIGVTKVEDDSYLYHIKPVVLQSLLKDTAKSFLSIAKEHSIAVDFELEPSAITVPVDVERIQFVIQIMFENALTYTPAGGRVKVSVRRMGRSAILSIKDSGIGITKEEMSFVFSKFYRSDRARRSDTEGLGIGLYSAKKIVARMNGKIKAFSSGAGQGSEFVLELPLA